MLLFSPAISEFLKNLGLSKEDNIAIVPKSDSAGVPGDLMIFRYDLRQRLVMLVQPIAKEPKTGNLLLTCVNVPLDTIQTKEDIASLYKNRRSSLPEDNYRTYRMNVIFGPLMRLRLR
jgi:hypothetical protein